MGNKIEIYKDNKQEYRWTITCLKNGKTVGASSEGFSSLVNCKNNLKLVSDAIIDYIKNH